MVWYAIGFLSANFSLPGPLFSRVNPDIRDRQTEGSFKIVTLAPKKL